LIIIYIFFYVLINYIINLVIPHIKDGKAETLPLHRLTYNVKFYKWEPLDLKTCPYIVLVVKEIHSHPSPPSHSIPKSIKNQLQKIIKTSNQNLEDVTPQKLISGIFFFFLKLFSIINLFLFAFFLGNLFKGVFGNHVLTEIHASLNNADKLRTLIH
jgi:hypothetical protein